MIKRWWIGPLALLLACAVYASDQPQQQRSTESLADLARRLKAERAERGNKPNKVYTNDDVPRGTGSISVVGGPTLPAKPAEPGAANGPRVSTPPSGAPSESKKEKYFREESAKLHSQLELHQRELAVLQQQENLNQLQYYPDPNKTLQQEYSRSDINKRARAIDEKKQQIADDERSIANLAEELRREGGDPAWLREGTTQPQAGSTTGKSGTSEFATRAAGNKGGAQNREYWQGRFRAAREALATAEEQQRVAEDELSLLQIQQARELNSNAAGEIKQKLSAKQAEVEEKRQATAKAQQALDDLQKEFEASGAPAEWGQPQ